LTTITEAEEGSPLFHFHDCCQWKSKIKDGVGLGTRLLRIT